MQAHCLTLVVNICVLSTTWYIQDALDAEEAEGNEVGDDVIAVVSPAQPTAVNPYGTHETHVAAILERSHRRPLREPRRR